MLQLIQKDLTFEPSGRIVRAREYQTYVESQEIIAAAKAEAEQIIADAKEEFEKQKTRGYQTGLMEGQMEMAEQMMDSVTRTVDYFEDLESTVADIVIKAIRRIVGDMDNTDVVMKVIKNSLSVARNQAQVSIRVCPEEADAVKSRIDEVKAAYPVIKFIDVVPDSRLSPGGCVMETEVGVVDASVDVQIEGIRKSLEKRIGRSN